MAIVYNSMIRIQGRLGDLVYCRYGNKTVVRKLPAKRENKYSQLQIEHQAKFALMTGFHRSLHRFFKVTYKVWNKNKTGYQKAFSENYRNALTGSYPSYSLDYRKVCLGNGRLPNVRNPVAETIEQGKLRVTWQICENHFGALCSDQLYIAIYCEKSKDWIYKFGCVEKHKQEFQVDVCPFNGSPVQVFIGFTSADKKDVSRPLYLGELLI